MTEAQFALLQDKVSVWRRDSQTGNMELRDYNGRAAEALTIALAERARLFEALKAVRDFVEAEVENRGAAGSDHSDYQSEAQEALDVIDAAIPV